MSNQQNNFIWLFLCSLLRFITYANVFLKAKPLLLFLISWKEQGSKGCEHLTGKQYFLWVLALKIWWPVNSCHFSYIILTSAGIMIQELEWKSLTDLIICKQNLMFIG